MTKPPASLALWKARAYFLKRAVKSRMAAFDLRACYAGKTEAAFRPRYLNETEAPHMPRAEQF